MNAYVNNDSYIWVIVLKNTNAAIGSISVIEISEKNERVEVGYNIGRAWWNQGIMTEALLAVISFLFECVNVHRIQAICNELNPASGRVMQKAGMTLEGILRRHSKQPDGSYDNVHIYAVLKEEWRPRK